MKSFLQIWAVLFWINAVFELALSVAPLFTHMPPRDSRGSVSLFVMVGLLAWREAQRTPE